MTDHELLVALWIASCLWLTVYAALHLRRWANAHSRLAIYIGLAMRLAALRRIVDQALDDAEEWARREAIAGGPDQRGTIVIPRHDGGTADDDRTRRDVTATPARDPATRRPAGARGASAARSEMEQERPDHADARHLVDPR